MFLLTGTFKFTIAHHCINTCPKQLQFWSLQKTLWVIIVEPLRYVFIIIHSFILLNDNLSLDYLYKNLNKKWPPTSDTRMVTSPRWHNELHSLQTWHGEPWWRMAATHSHDSSGLEMHMHLELWVCFIFDFFLILLNNQLQLRPHLWNRNHYKQVPVIWRRLVSFFFFFFFSFELFLLFNRYVWWNVTDDCNMKTATTLIAMSPATSNGNFFFPFFLFLIFIIRFVQQYDATTTEWCWANTLFYFKT